MQITFVCSIFFLFFVKKGNLNNSVACYWYYDLHVSNVLIRRLKYSNDENV